MASKILVWNVRGLNDRAKRDNVRKVVDQCRPSIVCLQETKLSFISEWDVLSFLGPDLHPLFFSLPKEPAAAFWSHGEAPTSLALPTKYTDILFQFNFKLPMSQPGGSLVYMARRVMLTRSPSWRSYKKCVPSVRDHCVLGEILI